MLDSTQTTPSDAAAPPVAPVRDSSQARLPLLAFVADDETEVALRGGLLNAATGIDIRRGTIVQAIRHLAKEPTPRALVVDISGVTSPLAALDRLSGVCTPDVSVLVVGEYNEIGLYRHLVRNMGVAEYIHKPLTRDRVSRLFVPHIMGVTAECHGSHGGKVIAVCGARGGAGTTTVAVNLALQLADATHSHVALLDLHLKQGTTALMLGVRAVGGLRIALEEPERADALFLDRVCIAINERVRLIAADEALDSTPAPTGEGVTSLLELLRRRFNYIVIDLPVPATPAELRALHEMRHLLIVMPPDLAGVRDADRLRQLASAFGTCHTTIVLNRASMQGALKMPHIEEGLGSRPTIVIPELGKQLGRAANIGKPALGECTVFHKAMALLAQEVSGAAATELPTNRWSLWDRLVRR